MSDQSIEEGPLKSIIGHDSYDRLISQTDYELDNGAWVLTSNIDYVYYSTPSSVINIKENKKLIKIFDILGRETKEKKNTPLFYIYDDGTVEKKITTNKTY